MFICVQRTTLIKWLLAGLVVLAGMAGVASLIIQHSRQTAQPALATGRPEYAASEEPAAVLDPAHQVLERELASARDISEVYWSPGGDMAAYVRKGGSRICLKKTGIKKELVLGSYSSRCVGMFWSPNNLYLMVSEKSGDGLINRIFRVDTQSELTPAIKSTLLPVWSPEGKRLAAANLEKDKNDYFITIRLYTIGNKDSRSLLKNPFKNGMYFIESWDQKGTLTYSEVDPSGQRVSKRLSIPKL